MEFLNWNVFLRIALLLNRWENYRTTRDFEQQLVLKLFAFLFVDGFLWYFLLAFLHIPFGEHLSKTLGLRQGAADSDPGFWMHALTTSISTLLLLCVPLATLMGLAPTALRHAHAPRLTSLALRSGLRCFGQLSRLSSRLVPYPARGKAHHSGSSLSSSSYDKLLSSPPEPGGSPPPTSPDGSPAAGRRQAAAPGSGPAAAADSGERDGGPLSTAEACAQPPPPPPPLEVPVVRLCAAAAESDSDSEGYSCLGRPLAARLQGYAPLRRAQRQQRSVFVAVRRVLRRVITADSLMDEARRPEFDTMLDLARLSLEFGYVLMFTVVWPLAPLAALLISALEQRASCVRLTVATRRPAGPRCSGLGTGDAWFDILSFLAGVSTVVNCGMIALSTPQLDVYFEAPLPPFEKLLFAVAAEHVLLLAKLALHYLMPDRPDTDLLQARVEREFKQKYMAGLGDGTAIGAAARSVDAGTALQQQPYQPQLSAAYPSSGPLNGGTVVSVRGARFGQARRYYHGYTCYGYLYSLPALIMALRPRRSPAARSRLPCSCRTRGALCSSTRPLYPTPSSAAACRPRRMQAARASRCTSQSR